MLRKDLVKPGECTRKLGCQCKECQKQLDIIQVPELYEEESTKLCQFCSKEIKERMYNFHIQKCQTKKRKNSTSLNIENKKNMRISIIIKHSKMENTK